MLHFVTGNKNKFLETQEMLPELQQLDIDLPEVQDIDPHEIVRHKLLAALAQHPGPLMVEDTSFSLDCLNGLPGPLIKWFQKSIGEQGIYEIGERYGNTKAYARTLIGYATSPDNLHIFEGVITGDVVPVQGESGFGWDVIFKPEGYDSSMAILGPEVKSKISMRRIAIEKFKEFLKSEK